jgi:hypothetical protein
LALRTRDTLGPHRPRYSHGGPEFHRLQLRHQLPPRQARRHRQPDGVRLPHQRRGRQRGLFRGRFLGGRENSGSRTTIGGLVAGAGAGAIVADTLCLVAQKVKDGTIDRLNLCGWSRGGGLCYKIANHLYMSYGRKLPVHIFAIDPVPGLKDNDMWQDVVLSGNVKACTIVLAQHDLRNNTFRPIVPTLNRHDTPYNIMPGGHSALVEPSDGRRAEASEIVHAWAMKFLADHGTRFKNGHTLSTDDIRRRYARIRDEFDDYLAASGGRRDRFFKNLDDTRDVYSAAGVKLATIPSRHVEPTFYINRHESALFRKHYPLLGAELRMRAAQRFLSGGRAKVSPLERFSNDLNRLYKRVRVVWTQVVQHISEVEAWRARRPKK